MELNNVELANISSVAQAILEYDSYKVCLINGEMGSGKTTLIRKICELLEVEDNVASPTFSLVNEYKAKQGLIYHFDFYRLNSLEEALDAGIEEYFYSGNLCLIEWPTLVESILPDRYLNVEIDNEDLDKRNYKLSTYEFD
jgi:tRNA threonylcarbamoyladenosine biosynthesis protein TsaE